MKGVVSYDYSVALSFTNLTASQMKYIHRHLAGFEKQTISRSEYFRLIYHNEHGVRVTSSWINQDAVLDWESCRPITHKGERHDYQDEERDKGQGAAVHPQL